ncbi:hypothetical protein ACLOJK_021175 [Asimina triloba]
MSFDHHTTSSEMETEQDPFSFTDLNQMPTESCRPLQINNLPDVMISSWLEMENMYGPTMPDDDALQHLRLLGDDHSFQLDTTTHHPSSSSSSFLPQNHHSYSTESFLLDLCDFDTTPAADTDAYCPILPELSAIVAPKAAAATEEEEEDEADRFLDDSDLYLITPAESHESCADQLHAQMSTATNISAAANNTTTATEDACPRKSKARKEVAARNKEEEEEEEAEEIGTDEDPKPGTLNCKNLVSERNRRKRLSQQLLALRALVPNITKMDKRSVLVDALAYLKSIREETERLQRELKESSSASRTNYEDDRSLVPSHSLPARLSNPKTKAQILERQPGQKESVVQ